MLAANSLLVEERSGGGHCGNRLSGLFTQDCASSRQSETPPIQCLVSFLRKTQPGRGKKTLALSHEGH